MWIRTQDKLELVDCKSVYIDYLKYVDGSKSEEYKVCSKEAAYNFIGTYATEKRALEVLDEIQEAIMGFMTYTEKEIDPSSGKIFNVENTDIGNTVYQMPAD